MLCLTSRSRRQYGLQLLALMRTQSTYSIFAGSQIYWVVYIWAFAAAFEPQRNHSKSSMGFKVGKLIHPIKQFAS